MTDVQNNAGGAHRGGLNDVLEAICAAQVIPAGTSCPAVAPTAALQLLLGPLPRSAQHLLFARRREALRATFTAGGTTHQRAHQHVRSHVLLCLEAPFPVSAARRELLTRRANEAAETIIFKINFRCYFLLSKR